MSHSARDHISVSCRLSPVNVHRFHKICIDEWLLHRGRPQAPIPGLSVRGMPLCPLCKQPPINVPAPTNVLDPTKP